VLAEDREERGEDGPVDGWRAAIWGSQPSPTERAKDDASDWGRRSGEIWGRHALPSAGESLPVAAEPLIPPIELIPAPVEDIIPMPAEDAAPAVEEDFWGASEPEVDPSLPDIWGAGSGEPASIGKVRRLRRVAAPSSGRPASLPGAHGSGTRYMLPESWAAAPKRRSLLERWLGGD
jgi:hypothetical protein